MESLNHRDDEGIEFVRDSKGIKRGLWQSR